MTESIIDQETIDMLISMTGEDFLQELVEAYLEDTPQLFASMRRAIEENDAELFRRSAHSLKTSSASLGALEFSEQARHLEMMGKNNQLADADSGVDSIEEAFESVKTALRKLAYGA